METIFVHRYPQKLEEEVVKQIRAGADLIKIINDPVTFTENDIKFVVELSAKHSLKVAYHTYTDEASNIGVNAGVASLEHWHGGNMDCLQE